MFTNCNICSHLVVNPNEGKGIMCTDNGYMGKSLYPLLNIAINLKLLFKKKKKAITLFN